MQKYDVTKPIILKKGVYKLNSEANFNYQLNRVINWDGGRLEDVKEVSDRIHNSDDWKRELIAIGDEAMKEGRTDNAYEAKDAYSYAKKLKLYDIAPVADQITQDMLILGASGDHFIDYHLIGKEINMLRNVRSLTFRLFTDKEEAENHCNVGNGKLAIDEILSWITRIGSKK